MKKLFSFTGIGYAICLAALTSCTDASQTRYTDFYDLQNEGLIPGKEYVFRPDSPSPNDSSGNVFSFNLIVRYSDNCRISNLPLEIEYGSLDSDSIVREACDVKLFNSNGQPIGKGSYSVFETSVTLTEISPFQEGLFFSVSSQEPDTSGIISIGIGYEVLPQETKDF